MKTFFLLTAICATLLPATLSAAEKWKITGELEEACACNAPCPCWFNSIPTRMQCGGGQVLFIEKGRYGSARLGGLAVAHMGQSPKGETMMNSFGNWEFSYLYIDEKADAAQRKALEQIGRIALPLAASKNIKIRYVPITRTTQGSEHRITLGEFGSFNGHLLEGGLGGTPKIVNPPGADPIHHEYEQGKTSKLAYNDAGQKWDYKGTNYMFGKFAVDSGQYEKYAAGLAQKMGAKKKIEGQKKQD